MTQTVRSWRMIAAARVALVASLSCWCAGQAATEPADASAFSVTVATGQVTVLLNEQVVTVYRFGGGSRPLLYPLRGVDGVERTRRWPVGTARAGEAKDHPHHRSVWFAHGDVNGHDFWAEGEGRGRVEQTELVRAEGQGPRAVLETRNRWVVADASGGQSGADRVICTDRRRLQFTKVAAGLAVDFDITVHASHGPLRFGDTKEGTMAVRLHPALRLRGKVATGAARNSEGVTGRAVWGKRARWVDYFGTVDETPVGVALFDHPSSPSHPTWWHARDYGLVAANPFGVHDFERKPAGVGARTVAKGESLRFRYRILLHAGEATDVDAAYDEYVRSTSQNQPAATPTAEPKDRVDRGGVDRR